MQTIRKTFYSFNFSPLYFSLIITLLILPGISAFSAVVSSVTDGNWSNGSTWDTGAAPSCGDTIIISAGTTVTVDVQVLLDDCPDPSFMLVEGTLDFNTGKKMYMSAGSGISVVGNGQITGGGGGGKANLINIGGVDVWDSGGGDIITPTVIGTEFGIEIKSITSGDFNVASTWDCNCIPDSTNVATIVAGHTVTVSNPAYIFSLNINGTLEIQNSQELYVRNHWNNNGAFIYNESTVSFGGSGAQSLSGVRGQTFYNITVKNGCDLSNNAGLLNLVGILAFQNGTFNTGDSLNLVSSLGQTGAIGSLRQGTLVGNVFSNRHIMSGATGWRFLTSCIQGATLEDIDDDIITSGLPGSDYPNFSFISVYDYDETTPGHKDEGYVVPASMSQTIGAGKGYWVFAGDNLTGTAAFNIDFYGAINQGPINLPVTYTNSGNPGDGWNLVANPYPCGIDWDDPNWTKTNISDETHVFDPNSGTYAVYAAGVGANGGSRVIASNQAFWIKATASSPQLTAEEGCKVGDNTDPYKSQASKKTLKIYCKQDISSPFNDEIVLMHDVKRAKKVLATKFLSTNDSVLNVMFFSDNTSASIQSLGNSFDTIPIQLIGNSPNTVLSFKNNGLLEEYWQVYLIDLSTNQKYLITEDCSFDLGKTVVDSNNDLALIFLPKLTFSRINATCKLSNNGSIHTNQVSMSDLMTLTGNADGHVYSSANGSWKDLHVGQYNLQVLNPIDNLSSFDTTFVIEPSITSIEVGVNTVADQSDQLVISNQFQSNSWNINQVEIAQNVESIDLQKFNEFFVKNNSNIIHCIYIDSVGCQKIHQWTVFASDLPLVYPNPYSSEKRLKVFVNEGDNTIEVYKLNGQLVSTKEVSVEESGHAEIKDLNLKPGQYIVIVKSLDTTNYVKLIVNE